MEDLGVVGKTILKFIFKMCNGGGVEDWIDLRQDRDVWRAVVNAVINLRFS